MAYLTIRIKNTDGFSQTDLTKDRMVVGRASKTDVPIQHTSISREHFALVREGDGWLVEDLGSSNGTWVNKVKVAGRIAIKERDIVKAGQARFTFHAGNRGDADAEAAVDIGIDDEPSDIRGPSRTRGAN